MKHTIEWDTKVLKVDGRVIDIRESQAVWNKSQEFAFGYCGSGPAQAALAILLHVTRNKDMALQHFQPFKEVFCANVEQEKAWTKVVDVEAWMAIRSGGSVTLN